MAEKITGLIGPGTVLCDHMSYVFMFLSVATSNMVATALAKQVISLLLFQSCLVFFLCSKLKSNLKRFICFRTGQERSATSNLCLALHWIGLWTNDAFVDKIIWTLGCYWYTSSLPKVSILSSTCSEMYLDFCLCVLFGQLLQEGKTLRLYLQPIHIFKYLFYILIYNHHLSQILLMNDVSL